MDRLRRFMVALDRSDMDTYLIKAAAVFASNYQDATFYFFYVSPSLEIPPKVHEKYPDLKVQLMSGYAESTNTRLVDEKTLKALLQKPFTPGQLLKAIRDLMDH